MVRSHRHPDAFTLVELLVVIGIIALLIAILLPCLNAARQAAQRASCAARIHSILIAAQTHTMDHRGYYPLVGVLPGYTPAELEDPYSTKYDYFQDDTSYYSRFPAPITMALALDMSHRGVLQHADNQSLGAEETDPLGFIRDFMCPSQANSVDGLIQIPLLYISKPQQSGAAIAYTEAQSYIFNEAICGWSDSDTSYRLRGLAKQVRQPVSTMFVADGIMGYTMELRIPSWDNSEGMLSLYNIANEPPVTMADALSGNGSGIGKAGDHANFDLFRHQGRINIGFCDGHVENRIISSYGLSSAYLLAP